METLREKINRFWVGMIAGAVGPIFGFLTFYLITSSHMTLIQFWKFIANNGQTHSGIISVSLIFNLVFFFAGTRSDALRFSQGVLGATLLYAPLVIYFKYVA